MSSDVVGRWTVSLADGIHKVEFEHGTLSGKRVIRVDGKVRLFYMRLTQKSQVDICGF